MYRASPGSEYYALRPTRLRSDIGLQQNHTVRCAKDRIRMVPTSLLLGQRSRPPAYPCGLALATP